MLAHLILAPGLYGDATTVLQPVFEGKGLAITGIGSLVGACG